LQYFRKKMGATSGAGTAYLSWAPELIPAFCWGSWYSIFSIMCMFCRWMFVLFLLTIVLSVLLQYRDSDYPFGIFKLFLHSSLLACILSSIQQRESSGFTHICRLWSVGHQQNKVQNIQIRCQGTVVEYNISANISYPPKRNGADQIRNE